MQAQVSRGDAPIDFAAIGGEAKLPPLGDAARQLLALSDDEDFDARVLSVIAQDDPVHLARLVSLANAAARGLTRPALTADEAIRVIGTRDARAAMLALALAATFAGGADTVALRMRLVVHAVNLVLSARRVSSFLALDRTRAATLQMAALFDPLGIHAALVLPHRQRDRLVDALRVDPPGVTWPHGVAVLDGYWLASAAIARGWRVGDEVVTAIASRWSAQRGVEAGLDAALLWLTHELLARRLRGERECAGLLAAPHPLPPEVAAQLASERAADLAYSEA